MSINLVLASTSPFRAQLLTRLGLPFETDSPAVDESRLPDEAAEALVQRLARAKAEAVAGRHPDSLIIGSDQVAVIDGEILGKPGERERAIAQLQRASGKVVTFFTGLCLYNSRSGRSQVVCEPFRVHFRELDTHQITRYIDREQPLNCAGSFKSEGLGITLFRRLEGDDPNALIGLPLIRLTELLYNEGVFLP
ncbi:Maf family protein [endosymbiont of unidentified scaly snail isolate Monju]|uniref:Maf family protein n=1 Tax=endosymbiont of unidentified scaly snail isolate Monju TaxID=1248727 RepID=UPI0003891E8D|nr:nucleoside triphosphate pyrophosphatase [endosymbiont of unidentified scaly snail isolate Monju]BAN69116.1 septum formation protein [endosymbiont of unidentified scaly snail isolate Monju]